MAVSGTRPVGNPYPSAARTTGSNPTTIPIAGRIAFTLPATRSCTYGSRLETTMILAPAENWVMRARNSFEFIWKPFD